MRRVTASERQNGAIILSEPQEHSHGERQYNAQTLRPPLTSPKLKPMWLPKNGAMVHFILSSRS
jgi:hypothetical protein